MRTTKEEIRLHINYIEKYSDYKVVRDFREKTTTYNVKLNDVIVAIVKSNNNSDIFDMLTPFWDIAFDNHCETIERRKMMLQ